MKIKIHKKIIAIIVGTSIIITGVPASILWLKEAKALDDPNGENQRMAAEISNMTGVPIEEILKQREKETSWNAVLDKLKNKNKSNLAIEKENRNSLLTQSGLDEDFIENLKKEGFNSDSIMQAKLLAERVIFQLQEISSNTQNESLKPEVNIIPLEDKVSNTAKDDTGIYAELSSKFDIKIAITLMLKLEKEFKSFENVMDEYLFSLQINIDLNDYLTDKAAYQKQKEEKSIYLDKSTIITLVKMEDRMLKKIQDENLKSRAELTPSLSQNNVEASARSIDNIPQSPLPEVMDVRPKSPADEIMQEIKGINPFK